MRASVLVLLRDGVVFRELVRVLRRGHLRAELVQLVLLVGHGLRSARSSRHMALGTSHYYKAALELFAIQRVPVVSHP